MPEGRWMRLALSLAANGRGAVEPNPLVGAVVVRDNEAVGQGWHQRFGGPHAEVFALAQAGEQARGATLYVTLEPCCHHGKTPPCAEAVVRAGIARVVVAMPDPFPRVAGGGLAYLRAAGIQVEVGACEAEARRLNAPYLKLLATGRPWVIAKWAMTLDGRMATRTGDSRWISNEASRRRVHERRGQVDAIVTGIGTALADDPLLTARPPGPRVPARVVLDSSCRLPVSSQLVRTARETPVLVVGRGEGRALVEAGCEVLALDNLGDLLDELGRRRMTNVMLEGGAGVLGGFLDAGLIDEAMVFIAPLLVGGAAALSPIGGMGGALIANGWRITEPEVEVLKGDVYVRGLLRRGGETG